MRVEILEGRAMFGLGLSEILVVLLLGLFFIGPKELPRIARTLGRYMHNFKQTIKEIQDHIEKEVEDEDEK